MKQFKTISDLVIVSKQHNNNGFIQYGTRQKHKPIAQRRDGELLRQLDAASQSILISS
jgi:hypothetical protein